MDLNEPVYRIVDPSRPRYPGINTFFAVLTLLLLLCSPAIVFAAYSAAF